MNSGNFTYAWEYGVRPDHIDEFVEAYGAEGEWARLFRRDPGYVRTMLLSDTEEPRRFVTIDFWTSEAARDRFRTENHDAFEALDRKCEELTTSETLIGNFSRRGSPGE